LTAADTVILYDSDWNPQSDLQAQARCHRIGQTKNVKVYRLLTRKTYEMQMFHMSSLKMGLDQAVLQGFESGGGDSEQVSNDKVPSLVCIFFQIV
jgi:chromodomain-helicase-DNA-binding protein 7